MPAEADVRFVEADPFGNCGVGRRRRGEPLRQARQREIDGERTGGAMAHEADDVADLLLQHDSQVLGGEKVRARGRGRSGRPVPMVGWPANGNSRPGVKIRILAEWAGFLGSNTNTVSDRLNSRAILCMRAPSRPSQSSTTASGLPASACVSEDVERIEAARHGETPSAAFALLGVARRSRRAAARHGHVVGQPLEAAHADHRVVDARIEWGRARDRVERVAAVAPTGAPVPAVR